MKVLKTAVKVIGVVAGVALIATGVGAFAGTALAAGVLGISWTAIAAGAALAGALLDTLSPSKPKAGSAIGSQTQWSADPNAGEPLALGRTAYAGSIVHRETFGTQGKYFGNVLVWSTGGPSHEFEAFQIDRVTVPFSGAAATGAYSGFLWLKKQLGACPESTALTPVNGSLPGWTSAHKLSGKTAGLLELMFDKEGKQWAGGFPQSILAILKGPRCYDPRLDSTYPGGSGACRWNDETTWVFSENPAIHAITWSLGRHQNGELVTGVGMPVGFIDLPRFVDWANVCDANVWKVGGMVSSLDDKWDVLKKICIAGAARPVKLGGTLSVDFDAPRVSLATVTSKDLAGSVRVVGTTPLRSRINTAVPRLRLETHGWEVATLSPVPVADYVTADGRKRSQEIDLELVQDKDQAAELCTYDIVNAREFGPITLPLQMRFVGYKPGDCLTLQIPEAGLVDRDFVVRTRNLDPESAIATLEGVSETPEKHDFALGRTGTAPPIPTLTPVDLSDVPAPGSGAWSLSAASLSGANGERVPILRVTGAVDNPNAEAIVFEWRVNGDTAWTGMEMTPSGATLFDIPAVRPGTTYQAAVSYIVRGVRGARRILGPVTTGALYSDTTGYDTLVIDPFVNAVTARGRSIQATVSGGGYNNVARSTPITGPCYVEMDIVPGNAWNLLALDTGASTYGYNNVTFTAHYNDAVDAINIYGNGNGTNLSNPPVVPDQAGKLRIEYTGHSYRVLINGKQYGADFPAAVGLTHYPKWWAYSGLNTYTGLDAGPLEQQVGQNWTPLVTHGIQRSGNGFRSTVFTGWASSFYSRERLSQARVSFRFDQTDQPIMVGLSENPAASSSYTDGYLIYGNAGGGLYAYILGDGVLIGTYAAGDEGAVEHRDNTILFFKNGAILHTHTSGITPGMLMGVDSSFYDLGSVRDVAFTAAGQANYWVDARFKRSVSKPATPTGETPSGWSNAIPAGTERLWESRATRYRTGGIVGAWSEPVSRDGSSARGAYASGDTYYLGDTVSFNGGTYVAVQDGFSGQAPSGTSSTTAYWDVVAAPGTPGAPATPPSAFTATIDIPSGPNVNLRTLADANGYTGASDATITFEVESGVVIRGLASPLGSGAGGNGIDSGTWPTADYTINLTVRIKNGGIVDGGGGSGGNNVEYDAAGNGGPGGHAIYCRLPMTVIVDAGGLLRGGGGGGGAAKARNQMIGGEYYTFTFGAGGGGFPNGRAGEGSPNGAAGTTGGGGAGGDGSGTYDGGAGGGAGAAGSAGTGPTGTGIFGPGGGGAAGYAVKKNGHTVSVTGSYSGTAG